MLSNFPGGNEVILACRDRDNGLAAVESIKAEFPNSLVHFMQVSISLFLLLHGARGKGKTRTKADFVLFLCINHVR